MPITFAQPEPFAPEINAGYGAAEAYAQFAPVLQQGQSAANSLLESQAGRMQQAGLAQAQLRLQSQAVGANLASQNQNAALGAQTAILNNNQNNAESAYEANLRSVNFQQGLQFQGAQGQLDQQQHAELQNWLQNQEMTQQEQMFLSRQKYGSTQIEMDRQAGKITDQEADQMQLRLKTGIDIGDARLKKTQQQHMETQNKLDNQRLLEATAHQLTAAKLDAMSVQDRSPTVYDNAMMAAATPEVTADFDAQHPGWADSNVLAPARKAAIDAEVKARVAADGGASQYFQTKVGHYEKVVHPKDDTAATQKAYVQQTKDYIAAKGKEVDRIYKEHKEFSTSDEGKKRIEAGDYRRPTDDEVNAQAERNVAALKPTPPAESAKPKRQPWAGLVNKSAAGQPAAAGGQPAAAPPTEADLNKPVNESKPQEWTPYQRTQMIAADRGIQEASLRTDLPPTLRHEYVKNLEEAKAIFVAGDAAKKKDRLQEIAQFIATIPAPPQAKPPQPPPQQQQGPATPPPDPGFLSG